MNIGIDGGALSVDDNRLKVGTYRVAYNLVKELPRIDVKSFYRIYSFGRGGETLRAGDSAGGQGNVEFIQLPRPGFQKLWQPLELICNPVDAYLGISQSLPLTLYDVNKIGFIYDIGFLDHQEYYRESYYALSSQTSALVKRAAHIVTISKSSADSIRRRYGVPKEKITVAYLGVESEFRSTGKRYDAPLPYFLFVGALKPGKNVPMMLRTFADFLKRSKNLYDFLLIGSDYWLDPSIPATISSLGLRDRVKVMGFVDDKTLATYYRGAEALLSVSRIEGFGLPVVEAMACGCPVIGTTQGSHPEVIGNNGLLVDPDDEKSLVEAMKRLTRDRTMRKRMVTRGITRAGSFTWSGFTKTVLEIVKRTTPRS